MTDALAIDLSAPCWLWQGAIAPNGYGRIYIRDLYLLNGSGQKGAHRYMWEQLRGPIPFGMQIDHLCRVRHCVNPQHMEVVTVRENVLRGTSHIADNARKTHCKHGHEFTPENTLREKKGRSCRECNRGYSRNYQRRRRQGVL